MQMNKTAVSDFVGINWRTVGNCINAAWKRLEPDVSTRLHGLKRICVDETGSRKGYEYITVVYDMDRNRVVWVNEGVGRDVFEQFCLLLSPEERSKIEIIAGDGARWIDSCMKEYFPGATRCIDFFHVVEWANEALDKVRIDTAKKALKEYEKLREDLLREEAERRIEQSKLRIAYIVARSELDSMPQRGRPSKRKNELQAYISELESLINPINLQAGYMSDELLPEHRELIINYAQLNRQSDADESDLAKARQALTEALTEAEKIFASRTFRGRPSAKVQRIMNFISLFGPVDKQWNASGKAGRPRKDNLSLDHQRRVDEYKARAVGIKGSKHALGHRPEKCTESQRDKIKLIENSYPELYRAYQLKESLRLILQMKDHEMAKNELDKWLSEVSECSIRPMKDLAGKIERHYTNILNSVKCQANSAKSESANTTIKAMIRVARGFRNINNLIAFIYLKCSDLVIPLNNRYQPTAEKSAEMRARDNELRRRREKKRQEAYHQAKTA